MSASEIFVYKLIQHHRFHLCQISYAEREKVRLVLDVKLMDLEDTKHLSSCSAYMSIISTILLSSPILAWIFFFKKNKP